MSSEPRASHRQALLPASEYDAREVTFGHEAPVSVLPPDREQPIDRVQRNSQEQQQLDDQEERQSFNAAFDPAFAITDDSDEIPPPQGRWGTVVALLALCTMCQANVFMLPYLFSVPASHGASASLQLDLDLSETAFGLLQSYVGIVPRLVWSHE